MAHKSEAGPIPTGWTLETEVQKDGSKILFYYCPGTGQHFYTYFELMRYVEYAKRERLGIYSPSCKSLKRKRNMKEKESIATESTKTPVLSIRRKPSSDSNSSTVDQSMDSESSSESESTDREKDQDYMPESESSVMADSQPSDIEFEVNQVLKEEMDDL